jgi:hypothetical protein
VLFLRPETDCPLRTETLDISNNGFYCITQQPFAPGEQVTCLIGIPVRSSGTPGCGDLLYLQAEVDVVRITITNGEGFGVACRISDYRVLRKGEVPSWAVVQDVSATPIEQLV